VGLVEPFIDTIVIITITAFVIIITGSWNDRVPTEVTLAGGDLAYVAGDEDGQFLRAAAPEEIRVVNGVVQASSEGEPVLAWHEVVVPLLFEDEAQTRPFTGVIEPALGTARSVDGTLHSSLYGDAVESGAPLTMLAFQRGLAPLGDWGHYVVILSVLLFAVSTAIAWSYYGDRSVHYLIGPQAVLPYRIIYVVMHFFGAVLPLVVAWNIGSVFLGAVMVPNLIALILLSRRVCELSDSYFARRPWTK
jgi:AGCS family alanine or glycine:cation symporter